ncbi:MAG: HD domain-containing phosphohydrolase [Desulfohalobiaceae bacterium]
MPHKPTYEELERRARELESSRDGPESIREPVLNLLRLMHEDSDLYGLIREVTSLVRSWFRCAAVGLRLKEDEDFPYWCTFGFPEEHIEAENRLCAVDEQGEHLRDANGDPVLECACGIVLSGRSAPELPFFTDYGGFVTNSTTELLASTSPSQRQTRTRNRCNREGYESVALVPLKLGTEIFGLLQVNDTRRNFFSDQSIIHLEQLAANLSLGLSQRRAIRDLRQREDITAHKRTEEALRRSESYYRSVFETSGAATIIIDSDLTISLANTRFLELTGYSRGELEGRMQWPELVHPDDTPSMREHHRLRRQDPDAAPRDCEFRLLDRQGNVRNVFLTVGMIAGTTQNVASLIDITERKMTEEELRSQRELLEVVIDGIEDVLAIQRDDLSIERFNQAGCELLGLPRKETGNKQCFELMGRSRECRPCASREALEKGGTASIEGYFPELGRHLRCRCSPVKDEQGNVLRLVEHLQDISEQKRHEERLQGERDYIYRIFNSMTQYVLVGGPDRRIEFLNPAARELFGDRVGKRCYEQLHRDSPCPQCPAPLVLQSGSADPEHFTIEAFSRILEGTMSKLDNLDGSSSLLAVMQDVTESRRAQEKVRYLSFHDTLTGLYNRTYLEEEMQRLSEDRYCPMGIIVCDINGLKLINDTLGHPEGDELLRACADILRRCFRSSDIAARFGGDEFAVLLPQCDEQILEDCRRRIKKETERYNELDSGFGFSLSVGSAIQYRPPVDMDALFKQADDSMYKEKLQERFSSRNDTVQALFKTLEERDYLSEGHADRLRDHALRLGRSLGLSQDRLKDLRLLARFHDLGKVAVPDHILFKPGELTDREFQEMKRHCEIGHRIAMSLKDMASIADFILKHHERWDGTGYPMGLSEEHIPLECRILAVVDAYDTMTHKRPYKRASTHSEAIQELRLCAGTQFDPDLVERFIRIQEG